MTAEMVVARPTDAIVAHFAGRPGRARVALRADRRVAVDRAVRAANFPAIGVLGRVAENFVAAPVVVVPLVVVAITVVVPVARVATVVARVDRVTVAARVVTVDGALPRNVVRMTVLTTASLFTRRTQVSTRWCKRSGSLAGPSNCSKSPARS